MQRSAQAGSGTGLALPSSYLPDLTPVVTRGITPEAIAAGLGAQLALGSEPATQVFTALLGREIAVDSIGPHRRNPDADEARILRLNDEEDLFVREGILRAGTIQCARVTLKLAYGRVCQLASGTTWGQIRSGTPAGTALAPYGLMPGHRKIEVVPGGNPAVKAWRVSTIRGMPVCITTEDVPGDLCIRLAAMANTACLRCRISRVPGDDVLDVLVELLLSRGQLIASGENGQVQPGNREQLVQLPGRDGGGRGEHLLQPSGRDSLPQLLHVACAEPAEARVLEVLSSQDPPVGPVPDAVLVHAESPGCFPDTDHLVRVGHAHVISWQ